MYVEQIFNDHEFKCSQRCITITQLPFPVGKCKS